MLVIQHNMRRFPLILEKYDSSRGGVIADVAHMANNNSFSRDTILTQTTFYYALKINHVIVQINLVSTMKIALALV
jgi:hypothetical protein